MALMRVLSMWLRAHRVDAQAAPAARRSRRVINRLYMERRSVDTWRLPMRNSRWDHGINRETRETPVYAMTVGKGGLKVQPLAEGGCGTRWRSPCWRTSFMTHHDG